MICGTHYNPAGLFRQEQLSIAIHVDLCVGAPAFYSFKNLRTALFDISCAIVSYGTEPIPIQFEIILDLIEMTCRGITIRLMKGHKLL